MTQAERHAKQETKIGEQAAEWLRQRELLKPKPLAVYVANAYRDSAPQRGTYSALGVLILIGAVRDTRVRGTFNGFVQEREAA